MPAGICTLASCSAADMSASGHLHFSIMCCELDGLLIGLPQEVRAIMAQYMPLQEQDADIRSTPNGI